MGTGSTQQRSTAVATGAWVKSKHDDMYLIPYVQVWELKLYFYPSAGGLKKKKKKKKKRKTLSGGGKSSIQRTEILYTPYYSANTALGYCSTRS